jgi:hypothetical protein
VTAEGEHGVYGLRVSGLAGAPSAEPPADWPRWVVRQEIGASDDAEGWTVWTSRARIGVPGQGEIHVRRAAREIVFSLRRPMPPAALLHPGLVAPAAIAAFWQDRACIHASAVLIDGRVWAVLADRNGGKSTTAALLADAGCPLFTDDMLIIDGTTCFAGPASVDLREEAAAALGGTPLGVVGTRERWRKHYDVPALHAPLGGWVALAWSDGPVDAGLIAPAAERLALLDYHKSMPIGGAQILDLAAVPMLRLRRPRALDRAGEAVQALLDATRATVCG